MDRLEARDYKEGSVIEISEYADLRTNRGQKAAQEAWGTPIVKVSEGLWRLGVRKTSDVV